MTDITPEEIAELERLPDAALLRTAQAAALLGCESKKLYRARKAGNPPPYIERPDYTPKDDGKPKRSTAGPAHLNAAPRTHSTSPVMYRKKDILRYRDHPNAPLHAYTFQSGQITGHALSLDSEEVIVGPIQLLLQEAWADVDLMQEALRIFQAEQKAAWDEAEMAYAKRLRSDIANAVEGAGKPDEPSII
ncbi:hypothetical protein [Pseudoxanthomonas winnipegensis]|uniref:hypothetical protein n=1 Tax=Pseudoxanthomonas winnipegensis TaxID=2480810 RepID=UPI00103E18E1|nr:hypothetical protein [Pseudoxanthomonas winnipegensis]TBV69735.1 hypothetical protein EYC45_18985 [Pseudoxanthomonas winnipegensis]